MNTTIDTVPTFPHVEAAFRRDDSVEVNLLGVSHVFDGAEARGEALQFLHGVASSADFDRPIRVFTHVAGEPDEDAILIVTPDGHYYDQNLPAGRYPVPGLDTETDEHHHGTELLDDNTDPTRRVDDATLDDPFPAVFRPATPPAADAARSSGGQMLSGPNVPRHHERKSFIADGPAQQPARQGWRGVFNRLGLRLDPGPVELAWRGDVRVVSQHWPGPQTIAVGNPKGSANKTPTTVMLSAVFARHGGAGVLAWDNNETRGSLAWRTQRANHEATVLDLLPRVDQLLGTGAQSAEMSYFAHHQPADKFDVLRSDQSVNGDHEVSAADVDAIHRVAARYYRMILMDSGNNERAANWRAMIDRAAVLVVPCTNVEDTAEAGARMLEALHGRDDHSRELAQNAVAIISKRTPGRDPNMDRIVRDFAPLAREVVTIPYDKALLSGVIHYDALRTDTQRAWLRAAAAVARGL